MPPNLDAPFVGSRDDLAIACSGAWPAVGVTDRPVNRSRHVLLTGMPSYVAVRLLWRILDTEPDARVTLLVKPDALARTEQALAARPLARSRVQLLEGDVVLPDCGIDAATLDALRDDLNDIYHLASLYHLGVDKRQAEEVNIRGTRNILSLARRCRALVRFNHYSTAFVCGDRTGIILESELDQGQGFRNTFERTKFTAELEVRRARQDLPLSIFRPSLVVGDSRTGEIDRLDGPYFLLQLIINNPTRLPIPLPSSSGFPLNLVPVDFVAEAMHALSLTPTTEGETFHLVDPAPVSTREAFRLVAELARRARPRGRLPGWLGRTLLALPVVEQWTRESRAFLHELDTLTMFNAMNTLQGLRRTEIVCPSFPLYVGNLVRHVQSRQTGWTEQLGAGDDVD